MGNKQNKLKKRVRLRKQIRRDNLRKGIAKRYRSRRKDEMSAEKASGPRIEMIQVSGGMIQINPGVVDRRPFCDPLFNGPPPPKIMRMSPDHYEINDIKSEEPAYSGEIISEISDVTTIKEELSFTEEPSNLTEFIPDVPDLNSIKSEELSTSAEFSSLITELNISLSGQPCTSAEHIPGPSIMSACKTQELSPSTEAEYTSLISDLKCYESGSESEALNISTGHVSDASDTAQETQISEPVMQPATVQETQMSDPLTQPTTLVTKPVMQPATSGLQEGSKKVRAKRSIDNKRMKSLSPQQQTQLKEAKMKKEVGRMLFPDAPTTPKKRRAPSPPRMPCVLVLGTPETAPPKKVQKWEQPGPSTSNNQASEPLDIDSLEIAFAEDIVETCEIEEWICDNPGSDVEADEEAIAYDDGTAVTIRPAIEISSSLPDNLNPRDVSRLLDREKQDDIYLRGMLGIDKLTFDWDQDPTTFKGIKETFTGTAGPTFSLDNLSPLDVLEKIWDDKLMTHIVEQTNLYAQQLLRKKTKQNARIRGWKDITIADLWVFFAVLILQSLDPRPVESEYWYSSIPELEMPGFKKIMPYKKFLLIKRCLHFVNNETISNPSKIEKIKPVVDHLNSKFAEMYDPAQEIALDESLLLWKGNLGFAQKISSKAAGVGIKSYELCESKSGYLLSLRLYSGKENSENNSDEHDPANEPDEKVSVIVFDLMRPHLNKGHTLVMDNFYNSPLLSRLLKLKKTDTMGTLRVNREFVPTSIKSLTKKDLRVGEIAYSHTNDLSVVLWRDANLVALISTFHQIEIGGKEKYGTYKYKPNIVLDYNKSMGGVDKKDQLLSAYPMERDRNHAWYKKVFRRLFNVSICNAWIIYHTKSAHTSHRKFREMLVRNILAKYQVPSDQVINQRPSGVRPLLVGGHYIERGLSARARCKWCADHGRESRTIRQCDVCKVALCPEPCFKNYHTLAG